MVSGTVTGTNNTSEGGEMTTQKTDLTAEQTSILNHTAHRAAQNAYCGDSEAMQGLVSLGLMRSLGKVSRCPDEYFTITAAGREALRAAK